MDTELGQHLRDALSDSYTLERELVGAGMEALHLSLKRKQSATSSLFIKSAPPLLWVT